MKINVSNIVLLGHMGSGKSTIGKSLAKKLSRDFVDSDYEIEKHTNTKIREIFLNQGENKFREIEENIIKQILDSKEKKVISPFASVGLYYFSSDDFFNQGLKQTIVNRENFHNKNLFLSSLYSKECEYDKIGYECKNIELIYNL